MREERVRRRGCPLVGGKAQAASHQLVRQICDVRDAKKIRSDLKEEEEEEKGKEKEKGKGEGKNSKRKNKLVELAPGVAASAAVMTAGFSTAEILGKGLLYLQGVEAAGASPMSGIPCSILLGLALRNQTALPLPKSLDPGVKFSTKKLLQGGIVCVGAKLSAVDLVSTGLIGLPAVMASVGAGLTFVPWFANKMGLPHKMGTLIAAGTSICGVTAISAVSPAIRYTLLSKDRERERERKREEKRSNVRIFDTK